MQLQKLDCDARPDRRVVGQVDGAHPALAEEPRNPVAADVASQQLVVGLDDGEVEAVLGAVEDLVLVLGLALGTGPGQGFSARRLARTVDARAKGAVKRSKAQPE